MLGIVAADDEATEVEAHQTTVGINLQCYHRLHTVDVDQGTVENTISSSS
jgi:hypothetical protein